MTNLNTFTAALLMAGAITGPTHAQQGALGERVCLKPTTKPRGKNARSRDAYLVQCELCERELCEFSDMSPERLYEWADTSGMTAARIAPSDVVKNKGDIAITLKVTKDGEEHQVNFFTALADCVRFIADNHIVPQQPPNGDIN